VFVETGTFKGSGIRTALNCGFEEIHSIEIDPTIHARAQKMFASCPNVHLHLGDSADLLWPVIRGINEPITFWLDGHFEPGFTLGKTEVPIMEELDAVSMHHLKNHAILIDDINQVGLDPDPAWKAHGNCWKDIALDKIRSSILRINPSYKFDFGDHPSPFGLKYSVFLAYMNRGVVDESWEIDFTSLW
jgi:hypothetical protein